MKEYKRGIYVSDDGVVGTTNKADVEYYESIILKNEPKVVLTVPGKDNLWVIYECNSFEDFVTAVHHIIASDTCYKTFDLNELKEWYFERQKYYCFAAESVDTSYSAGGFNEHVHEGVRILWSPVQQVINEYYDNIKYILYKKSEIDYFCDNHDLKKPI